MQSFHFFSFPIKVALEYTIRGVRFTMEEINLFVGGAALTVIAFLFLPHVFFINIIIAVVIFIITCGIYGYFNIKQEKWGGEKPLKHSQQFALLYKTHKNPVISFHCKDR